MSLVASQPAELFSVFGDDPDLAELVALFAEEMPDRIATLQAQCSAQDWASLTRTAHQLKGAAGSYGFDPITPAAARLEALSKQGVDPQSIGQATQELTALCRRVRPGVPTA